jgi:NAD(P)-dependent dehydrogenase (short-subunit alcohol dehydrogenase family)
MTSAPNPFRLDGQVAIITGASRGIGEAMARAMSAAGASVVLAARKPEALEAVAQQLRDAGGKALAVPTHTGRPEAVAALVDAALKAFGKVDILVNNAATNPHFGPMITADETVFQKTVDTNLKGTFELSRRVAVHLQERQAPGCILNISSVLGMQSSAMMGVYGVTKAGLISMTKTMAQELGPLGIRVNAVAPGLIKTQFASALTENETTRDQAVSRTPLGRLGAPEDLGNAAVFLCSDAARFITGHVLVVDGGLTLNAF